ncbi:MAG: ABC transporter permease [Clostridiaceae bacterium]|nr:ABC transporter permease [Clostridiaceae bacterium]
MSENKKSVNAMEVVSKYKKKSQTADIFRRLARNKTAIIGLAVVLFLLLLAIFADVLHDYDSQVIKQDIMQRLQSPSSEHWFGTDEMGRDIFARVCYGAKYSLLISFVAATASLTVGLICGSIAGYYGGKADMIIMRFMDVLLAIPGTLLAIAIVASLGSTITNLIIALSVSGIPGFSRIVRSSVLTVRDSEYVEAARAIGATDRTIIFKHVLPNGMAPLIVQSTLSIASVILTTAGLSFLGLGVPAPHPEWGAMLSNARSYIRDYSYMALFPGLAIMTTILCLNLLGDGLRDALDPRLK